MSFQLIHPAFVTRLAPILLWLEGGLAAAFAVLLVSYRRGFAVPPALLAVVAGALILALLFDAIRCLMGRRLVRGLAVAGALLLFGGGMANWLYSLQGFLILSEREAVPLAALSHLRKFEAGPLSNSEELASMLEVEKIELLPADGGFVPETLLRYGHDGAVRRLRVDSRHGAGAGTLRFHQGAFGFSPRVVITRDGKAVFDQVVPFRTVRHDGRRLSFEETFLVSSQGMTVRGALDLGSLDDDMKGHARLGVIVTKGGRELGRGELALGHFARLSDGSYIGYAGLKRWSEIDISRRNYPEPMIAGAALILLSAVVWPFARRRA